MDLKTYAVYQKLYHNGSLLDYVVKDEAVPIHVVEESFQDVYQNKQDAKAEALVDDYTKMLSENVPVVISQLETGGYTVTGDIPDTLIDAIHIIHHATTDDIIKSLVEYNLQTIHKQECRVLTASIKEHAERTRMRIDGLPKVLPVQADAAGSVMEDEGAADGAELVPEAETVLDAIPDMAETVLDAIPDMAETVLDAATEQVPDVPETITEAEAGSLEMMEPVKAMPVGDLEETQAEEVERTEAVPAEAAPVEADMAVEAPAEEDASEQPSFGAIVQAIYEKFCADLRKYNLDTRLGLAL